MRKMWLHISALLVPSLAMSQAAARPRPPVIDMHMHAHLPLVPAGSPAPCEPQPCQPAGSATASDSVTLRRTLEEMQRHNVVKGFLSGDVEVVKRWAAAAPDRFIAAPYVGRPGRPDIEILRGEFAAGSFAGMGEIGAQYSGIVPGDSGLTAYFALAEQHDVPVLIHTLGFGAHTRGFRVAAGNPVLLEPVLLRHPKLRLYVENAGYPHLGEMIAMMYQYPQLHGDLSTITWIIPREAFHDYLRALVRAGLGKRLMFGSDQMRWPELIGRGIGAIESADFLTEEQKRDILYHNAARFLRLEPHK